MKMSLKWLSKFVNLEGLSEEDIIQKVIKAGFEVEEVIHLGSGSHLVVGEILECSDHPDSDHLHVTKTDIGDEVLDIVCGAPNCRKGLKVIVAKVGAKLPGGDIKPSVIRGVPSNGMLCSLLELGVDKDLLDEDSGSQNGIEELPADMEVGSSDILNALGYEDTILDLSIYANRSDCLAMFSLAKEMAAILNRECVLPNYTGAAESVLPTSLKVNSLSANCPHYMGKVVGKVTLGPSPKWIKEVLRSSGIKSINNVVDISNLVMLETGQPLHFFDLASNPNRNISVVDDYEGEYTALDGISYDLKKGDLVITSDGQPIAIAGIMGGDGSKILDSTTGIIIESALFDHAQIRRTANRIGLMTEAASRFAKGLDPLAQDKAMDRAVQLLKEYADASEIEETAVYGSNHYEAHEVPETLEHLNALIGKEYTLDEVMDVLKRLDFNPRVENGTIISEIPSYRSQDILLREDIDEEIVRLTDFDDLKSTLPYLSQTTGKLTPRQNVRRVLRDSLMNLGMNETVSYTLSDDVGATQGVMNVGESIRLLLPISDARKALRTSLFPSMMETLSYNIAHRNADVNLFEISVLYAKDNEPTEHLGIVLHGDFGPKMIGKPSAEANYYTMKGILCMLMEKLGYSASRLKWEEGDNPLFHPYRCAKMYVDRKLIAEFGELHPTYAKENKLGQSCYAEVDIDALSSNKASAVKAGAINRYPAISRDISLLIRKDINVDDVMKTIHKAGGALVVSTKVFDVYEGKGIAENMRSVSINILYQAKDRTLSIEEINPIHEKVLNALSEKYETALRA